MNQDLAAQLEDLLSETRESVIERERSTFDRLAGPTAGSIVLFGAGGVGRNTLSGLRSLGIEPLAFADNNASLWDTSIDGLRVLDPGSAAAEFGESAVFVVTILAAEIGHPIDEVDAQLNAIAPARVVSVAFLYWKYPETFMPYYYLDSPHKVIDQADEVRRGLAVWADDESRAEYVAQVRSRLWWTWDELPPHSPEEDAYFPPDLPFVGGSNPAEVFVDCGAFDGDTVRAYIAHRGADFARIVALEPDPENFELLRAYAASLPPDVNSRIEVIKAAVGNHIGTVTFAATGSYDSHMGAEEGLEVRLETLDHLLDPATPTHIKMDIEGGELGALEGARGIITEGTARLTVCAYHTIDDPWRLPLFIQSVSDRYTFFLRRYLNGAWENVCYAVPTKQVAEWPEAG
jgi:FkbM family methyltransferase